MSMLKRSGLAIRATTLGIRSFHVSNIRFEKKESKVIKQQQEHGEIPKELVSGTPKELVTERVVRIYKESKPATQSGIWGMSVELTTLLKY